MILHASPLSFIIRCWPSGVLFLLMGAAATAHHSTGATYDPQQVATVEGDVVLFLFRNPHSFIQIEAKDPESGQAVPVALEWESAKQLGQDGINAKTLKPGDHVNVTGQLARKPGNRSLLLEKITRPADGWMWPGSKQLTR